jgi:hypothetical protein
MNGSGLKGVTLTDDYLEAYYDGDPNDQAAQKAFEEAVARARKLLGSDASSYRRTIDRFRAYGSGDGATHSYGDIESELRPTAPDQKVATTQRVASRLAGIEVAGTEQADLITEDQQALQERIAEAYAALPINGLDDPDVRRAYEELAAEVLEQFDALPIKVEVFEDKLSTIVGPGHNNASGEARSPCQQSA